MTPHNSNLLVPPQSTKMKLAKRKLEQRKRLIIKANNPLVIPVKIDGFADVFEKNSLKIKNKNIPFSIKFGDPLKFYDNDSIESITSQIEKIID